ncbi:MAG: alpha/beta hydrolase [Clostridiales bacterium]|nr:alpha/beta hydrolase [Clostridiales bacterium]
MNIKESAFEVKKGSLTIRGKEYRPCGEKLPIAIICHGFLATYKTTKHYAKQFARWGWAAYCFDFIGGGIGCSSDGRLKDMSVLTESEDLRAVIDYVKELSYTDENKITLMGCSQGGFVSAMVAAQLQEPPERLILLYPALCIPDDARKGEMMFFKFDPENIPNEISFGPLKLGGDYAAAVMEMDPFEQIKGYKGPVLILHGGRDKIVNISYAKKAKEAYGGNCSLNILPKAGHGFKKNEDKVAFSAIKEFLAKKHIT